MCLKPEVDLACGADVLTYKTSTENEIFGVMPIKIFRGLKTLWCFTVPYCMKAERGGGWGKGGS